MIQENEQLIKVLQKFPDQNPNPVLRFSDEGVLQYYNSPSEPIINAWKKDIPESARFVRVPALWNPLLRLHGRMYYTKEVLVKNGKLKDPEGFRARIFKEYHNRKNYMTSATAIQKIFADFGVTEDDFNKTFESFEVAQKLRLADDLARRYSIASTPSVVVNGKYRTNAGEAGSYPKLIKVINELITRESIR